jgi:hypothetical protein
MKRRYAIAFLVAVAVMVALLIAAVIAQVSESPDLLTPFCGAMLLIGAFFAIEVLFKPGYWQERFGFGRKEEEEEEAPATPVGPDGEPVRARKIRRRDRFSGGSP